MLLQVILTHSMVTSTIHNRQCMAVTYMVQQCYLLIVIRAGVHQTIIVIPIFQCSPFNLKDAFCANSEEIPLIVKTSTCNFALFEFTVSLRISFPLFLLAT